MALEGWLPQEPWSQAKSGNHEIDLLPMKILPLVPHNTPSITRVLIVCPPQPTIHGDVVVCLSAPLRSNSTLCEVTWNAQHVVLLQ